jgi:hypothetical protein
MVHSWVDAEPPGDAFFPPVDDAQWAPVSAEQRDGYEVVVYDRAAAR